MFMRPSFAPVPSLRLVTVCGSIDPISALAIIKVSSYLESESQEGENEKPKTTGEKNWWWISKVLIAPHISSCCPCVHHQTRQANLRTSCG